MEAAAPTVLRALRQPTTASDLLALKEARMETKTVLRALPQPTTASDLLALKEALIDAR